MSSSVSRYGRAAQVERQRALGEPAEPALEGADVRVVDVAVVDAGDGVADGLAAQLVGDLGHGGDLGAAGREQGDDLVVADLLAEQHAGEHLGHRAAGARSRPRARSAGGVDRCPGVPRGGAAADVDDLGAVVDLLGAGRRDALGEHRAGVVAAEALGVGAVEDREAQAGVEPALGVERELGVDREPGREREAGASVTSRSRSRAGHGRSGLTWSAVTGETPPQSSMPASSSTPKSSERLGGACRWISGGQDQPGQGDGVEVLVGRARRRSVHRRAGLGQEVLDDHLLHVAVAAVRRRRWPRARRCGRARDSPMPTRMPVVNGMRELAGGLERGQAALGRLVGRAPVGRRGRR